MEKQMDPAFEIPVELAACVRFHGHLCPGLVYGFLVAEAAIARLTLVRSGDEEIVAIVENDSCAVDSLQVLLGTTAGKGNLIIKDYGKNAYTVLNRSTRQALRFSRKKIYAYRGGEGGTFASLEAAVADGTATEEQKRRHKTLKAQDLLGQPVDAVFDISAVDYIEPPYAPLARSEACSLCGEMTMATKLVAAPGGRRLCRPCRQREAK